MPRKIVIYRFQTNPSSNMRIAEALVPFYRNYSSYATVHPTVFGAVSNFLSDYSPEEIFQAITAANCGNHFTIIELDENDVPLKTITSAGAEIFVGSSTVTTTQNGQTTVNQEFIDANMTEAELEAEFDRLLDKVHRHGLNSLTDVEKGRMEHLSQR